MKYQRTQIYLDPAEHAQLVEQARARGLSLAALLREIVGQHLRERQAPYGRVGFEAIVGVADVAEATDVARQQRAYRDAALDERYRKKVGRDE